jgi:hypothetical protein
MERAVFELDATFLAAAEKCHRVLVDQRHVPQIQDQLLRGCLDGQQLLKLLDILCRFDPAAECDENSTVPCSPGSEHASFLSFLSALLNERRLEQRQLAGQR